MFIDPAINPATRAPAERNVCGDEYARSATFRSSGARKTFWSFRSITLRPYGTRRLLSKGLFKKENKKSIVCITEFTL